MNCCDIKYLIVYLLFLFVYVVIYIGGIWFFVVIYLGFIVILVVELFVLQLLENYLQVVELECVWVWLFDYLLYFNVFLVYGLVGYYFYILLQGGFDGYEIMGMICSVGFILGMVGINVVYELGYCVDCFECFLVKVLLLLVLYIYFIIEYNLGYYKYVAMF